jgi:hypothetical protein
LAVSGNVPIGTKLSEGRFRAYWDWIKLNGANNMVDVNDPKPTSPPMPGPPQTPPTPQQSGGSFGNTYSDMPVVPIVPAGKETTGNK